MGRLMKNRLVIGASILGLAGSAGTGCAVIEPTGLSNPEAEFCVTQNGGESLLCCPSPGLGCQAVEAANES